MTRFAAGLALVLAIAACGSDDPKPVARGSGSSSSASSTSSSSSTSGASTDGSSSSSGATGTTAAAETTTTGASQPVDVLDVSGAGKLTTAAFDTDGEWEIHGDVGSPGDLFITVHGPNGEQVDSLHFSAPGGVSQQHASCAGCTLQIESMDPNVVHDPLLPPPGFHVVVTDLPA